MIFHRNDVTFIWFYRNRLQRYDKKCTYARKRVIFFELTTILTIFAARGLLYTTGLEGAVVMDDEW